MLTTLAMVASCSSSDSPDDAASTTVPPATAVVGDAPELDVQTLVAATIGESIPTQDVHLLIGIDRVDEDGTDVSIYDQVLDAVTATDDPTPIGDGLYTYAPVTGLEGRIVDSAGESVLGAEIGFGLLAVADGVTDEELAAIDNAGAAAFEPDQLREQPVLVVFSSTGTDDGPATLIVPGDQFELDLTFVSELAPGDIVRQTVLFGQALATPDEAELALSGEETFAHRFTSGNISTLIDAEGSSVISIAEEPAIEGSTLTRRQIKILKFAPLALIASGIVVARCASQLRRGDAVRCVHAVKSTADGARRQGRETNNRNRGLPPCRSIKCAFADGDVHLGTFDGRNYDLQAVGEFLAARSDDGHELHLRMAPYGESDRVSVSTALAARIGDVEIALHTEEQQVVMYVDGEETTLPRGSFLALGDGGVVLDTGDTHVLLWADGTRIDVRHNFDHFDVTMLPVDDESVGWEGLFGDRDGDTTNDLALVDGTVLDDPDADTLHGEFADAWRLTDDTSMLHYDAGESTDTFTDRDFPRVFTSIGDLDPGERAEAEAICVEYGITEPVALDACILDLALTGDPVFLLSAASMQHAMVGDDDSQLSVASFDIAPPRGTATEGDVPTEGMLAWLRGDDAIDGADGSWPGRGPVAVAGEWFTGPDALLTTLRGNPAVAFAGASQLALDVNIQPDAAPELTVAIVLSDVATENSNRKAYGHDDGGYDRAVGFDNRLPDRCYGVFNGSGVEPYVSLIRNESYILTDVWTPDTFTGYIDGSEVASLPAVSGPGSSQLFVGASSERFVEPWEGAIAEILVWDRVITDDERNTVNAYLVGRYGPSGPVSACPEG